MPHLSFSHKGSPHGKKNVFFWALPERGGGGGPLPSNLRESRFSRILENYFAISPLDLDLGASKFYFHFSKRVKPKIISLFISRKE